MMDESAASTDGAGMTYDAGLMLGRFQIVTRGHLEGALAMAAMCRNCILCIGSADQSRDLRNAWTVEERIEMWLAALPLELHGRFRFIAQQDLGNPLRWASAVENRTTGVLRQLGLDPDDASVGLFGHRKDATSFYLDDFPAYILEQLHNVDGINASDLRASYFAMPDFAAWAREAEGRVPPGVIAWLGRFRVTAEFGRLADETARIGTSDSDALAVEAIAVVVQGTHVLMRRRGTHPGKGHWALPEGKISASETPEGAAMRLAVERTGVDVSATTLRKAMRDRWTMSDPHRTTGVRTIGLATAFRLTPTPSGRTPQERRKSMALPRTRASDDVAWFSFDEVRTRRSEIHADHAIVIDQALERLGVRY